MGRKVVVVWSIMWKAVAGRVGIAEPRRDVDLGVREKS